MERLITKSEKKKKQDRFIFWMSLGLIIIMSLSILGFSLMSFTPSGGTGSGKVSINGVEFTPKFNLWSTVIGNYEFYFNYLPNETMVEVNGEINKIDHYTNKPLYLVAEELSLREVMNNLNSFVERIQGACIEGGACSGNFPIKNCSEDNIIVIKTGEAQLYQEENCVFIVGNDDEEINRVGDEFSYRVLGIKSS